MATFRAPGFDATRDTISWGRVEVVPGGVYRIDFWGRSNRSTEYTLHAVPMLDPLDETPVALSASAPSGVRVAGYDWTVCSTDCSVRYGGASGEDQAVDVYEITVGSELTSIRLVAPEAEGIDARLVGPYGEVVGHRSQERMFHLGAQQSLFGASPTSYLVDPDRRTWSHNEWLVDGAAGTYTLRVIDIAGESGKRDYVVSVGLPEQVWNEWSRELCPPVEETHGWNPLGLKDPLFGCQWNLTRERGINAVLAWRLGAYGEGVEVAVVDSGLDLMHEDLWHPEYTHIGYTAESYQSPTMPDPFLEYGENHDYTGYGTIRDNVSSHGTAVAGIIAARHNEQGISGVAPKASLRGRNLLATTSISTVIDAYTRDADTVDVMNHSWGEPAGHSAVVDLNSLYWAVEDTLAARNGLGVIHVRAGGNQYPQQALSAIYEMRNHHGVVTVCALDEHGRKSWYSEQGANLWLCAPGDKAVRAGNTATDHLNSRRWGLPSPDVGHQYTNFNGTSSAAPHVSGVVALMRGVRPDLTWRDVKLILAATATETDPEVLRELSAFTRGADPTSFEWTPDVDDHEYMVYSNGGALYKNLPSSGRYSFSHRYGFGKADAAAAVNLARRWPGLPEYQRLLFEDETLARDRPWEIGDHNGTSNPPFHSRTIHVSGAIDFIEHVDVELDIETFYFRDLRVVITAPSGSKSLLSVPFRECWSYFGHEGDPLVDEPSEPPEFGQAPDPDQASIPGCIGHQADPLSRLLGIDPVGSPVLHELRIGTSRFLGEDPNGIWNLEIRDEEVGRGTSHLVENWSINIHGHGTLGEGGGGPPPYVPPSGDEDGDDGDDDDDDEEDDGGNDDAGGTDVQCRQVTPYWHGSGGFVVSPTNGRSADLTVACGDDEPETSTEQGREGDGLIVRRVQERSCRDDAGEPVVGKLSFEGIKTGGWYWVNGEENAAVSPLTCEGSSDGQPPPATPGVSITATPDGTWLHHDTTKLAGIVPHVAHEADVLHAPYWRGHGGIVGWPTNGSYVDVSIECGATNSSFRLEATADSGGTVIGLVQPAFCKNDAGEAIAGSMSVEGMRAGGWYWINGEWDAAVSVLLPEDQLQGPKPLVPDGVTVSKGKYGSLFEHHKSRRIGIVPRLTVEEPSSLNLQTAATNGSLVPSRD